MTLAEKAEKAFQGTNQVPDYGQRVMDGFGPGSVHVFPDGSVAAMWDDGTFSVAEVEE